MTVGADGEGVSELGPDSRGVWWVQTQGGTVHVWDLEEGTVLRAPGADSAAGTMRFDGDARRLLAIQVWPKVGECALFMLQHPHEEGRVVVRTCSIITNITRAPQ